MIEDSNKTRKSQVDKFREAARQLETDDDEKRFDERLGKVAKTSPNKLEETNTGKPAK